MANITKAERAARALADTTSGQPCVPRTPKADDRGRLEFLTVAAGAVESVRAEMQGKLSVGAKERVSAFAAVDAILAEADRRWPR